MEFEELEHLSKEPLAPGIIFWSAAETFAKKLRFALLGDRVLRSGLDGHCFASSQSSGQERDIGPRAGGGKSNPPCGFAMF